MPKKSFFVLMLVVFLLWVISIPMVLVLFSAPTEASSFGDMFGAVNALFSGLAFAGVVYALILQDAENKKNADQFQQSLRTTEISARLTAYATLLQECDSALQRYERWESVNSNSDYKNVKEKVRGKISEYRLEVEKLAGQLDASS